ncbi:hypothetical protein Tco_1076398 [Tanacetum coccineum]
MANRLMAPVTPPRATVTVLSTYEVGGPSTATPVRHPLAIMAPGGMASQAVQVVSKLEEMETRVQQVESIVDIHPGGQMTVPREDVIVWLRQQVQTLQTTLHGAELQN